MNAITIEIFSAGNVALEAENEQLRAEIVTWGEIWNNAELLAARVEALRDGTADLGRFGVATP